MSLRRVAVPLLATLLVSRSRPVVLLLAVEVLQAAIGITQCGDSLTGGTDLGEAATGVLQHDLAV